MLFELYQYLTSPCPRPIKEMGYLKELIGMAARHRRCRDAWGPHLRHCRDWIVEAMADCPRRDRVVVLGSGLLNDVPVDDLSQGFEDVVLVDILHLPVVRKALKPYDNIRLVEFDITGFVEPLYERVTKGADLSVPEHADIPANGADLVVSLNILSQLPILPFAYGEKKQCPLEEGVGRALIKGHLKALSELDARVCLISEVEQLLCQGDEVIERDDPLHGETIPQDLKGRSNSWDWRFAPHPERHPDYDLTYRIEGFMK